MHRLFFALWPDDVLRREIEAVAQSRQAQHPEGRAVHPDRYHMTLQFLGDFETLTGQLRETLLAAANTIAAPAPFELLLDQIGTFGAGRVVWLGCSNPPPQLLQLHHELGEALARAGVPSKPDAAFVPHVTLQRNVRQPMPGAMPALPWQVQAFVLVDSTAGDYRMLGRWSLRGDDVTCGCRIPASR